MKGGLTWMWWNGACTWACSMQPLQSNWFEKHSLQRKRGLDLLLQVLHGPSPEWEPGPSLRMISSRKEGIIEIQEFIGLNWSQSVNKLDKLMRRRPYLCMWFPPPSQSMRRSIRVSWEVPLNNRRLMLLRVRWEYRGSRRDMSRGGCAWDTTFDCTSSNSGGDMLWEGRWRLYGNLTTYSCYDIPSSWFRTMYGHGDARTMICSRWRKEETGGQCTRRDK